MHRVRKWTCAKEMDSWPEALSSETGERCSVLGPHGRVHTGLEQNQVRIKIHDPRVFTGKKLKLSFTWL